MSSQTANESASQGLFNAGYKLGEAHSNPYGLPPIMLPSGKMFNGHPVFVAPKVIIKDDPEEHHKKIREMPMREDDVVLVTFPKSGTHWMSQILSKLLNVSYTFASRADQHSMLEFVEDLSFLENLPSPRFINTHFCMDHLPEQIAEKRVKIVHVTRNPKDVLVSGYHHMKQLAPKMTFDDYFKAALTENYTARSHQYNFLRQLKDFERAHPGHPVKHVYFEDLKKDAVPVIQEVAQFLGVKASKERCQEIATECGFDKLKKAFDERERNAEFEGFNKTSIYRKGAVGDWKNTFTVAQNEIYEDFLRVQNEKGVDFTFEGM